MISNQPAPLRRTSLAAVAACMILVASIHGCSPRSGARGTPQPEGPPNVVIYLIDALRYDRLGINGFSAGPISPRIDALADQSVVFDQAYSCAPWTVPSVTSLLTSTYPCEHQVFVNGQKLDPSLRTIAERMKAAGYTTIARFSNPLLNAVPGLERGYDVYEYSGGDIVTEIARFLEDAPTGRPYYLYLHTIEPHDPVVTPDEWLPDGGRVDAETRTEMGELKRRYSGLTRADFDAKRPLGTIDNTEEQQKALTRFSELRHAIDFLYSASVRRADEGVGRMVDMLKARGAWDRTLFILLADHGEELGDHGGWFHEHSVYEELIHVPLIVHFPRGEFAGRRVDETVTLADILPTVQDCARGSNWSGRGRSLVKLLADGSPPAARGPIVTTMRVNRKKYYRPYKETRGDINLVIRDRTWKGIWNLEPGTFELYDLRRDPGEHFDVSARNEGVVGSMRRSAAAWLNRCRQSAVNAGDATDVVLNDEMIEALRAMGYIQ
ncbi:MAG: sulfatase [Acidobacteria bacterium]|nr:sulfatase [Acidobacteriota bacterium]